MTENTDHSRASGGAALGARLRRITERIDRDSGRVYADRGIVFEQRWYGVVNQLAINGRMTVGDIAAALRITHVSVSQARRSLEAAGLVMSHDDTTDARRRPIDLTDRGRAMVRDLTPLWRAFSSTAEDLNRKSGDLVALLDRLEALLNSRSLYDRILDRFAETHGDHEVGTDGDA